MRGVRAVGSVGSEHYTLILLTSHTHTLGVRFLVGDTVVAVARCALHRQQVQNTFTDTTHDTTYARHTLK